MFNKKKKKIHQIEFKMHQTPPDWYSAWYLKAEVHSNFFLFPLQLYREMGFHCFSCALHTCDQSMSGIMFPLKNW